MHQMHLINSATPGNRSKLMFSMKKKKMASSQKLISDTDAWQNLKVLWACFDRLELTPTSFNRVLLLGYTNGFQVLDVDDASTVNELVSKRDSPYMFLQMQPSPNPRENCEGFRTSHPLLLVAAGDKTQTQDSSQRRRDGLTDSHAGNLVSSPTSVRLYSLRSHNYVTHH